MKNIKIFKQLEHLFYHKYTNGFGNGYEYKYGNGLGNGCGCGCNHKIKYGNGYGNGINLYGFMDGNK
jgi:hypothetical protein